MQPAPPTQGWQTDPFQPVLKDGRLYGRGAADYKSGVVQHAANLSLFDGQPPVGIKILIEGEEETDSHLEAFVGANPEFFQTGVFVINDTGSGRVGEPMLSISKRGDAYCTVEMRIRPRGAYGDGWSNMMPGAVARAAAGHQERSSLCPAHGSALRSSPSSSSAAGSSRFGRGRARGDADGQDRPSAGRRLGPRPRYDASDQPAATDRRHSRWPVLRRGVWRAHRGRGVGGDRSSHRGHHAARHRVRPERVRLSAWP